MTNKENALKKISAIKNDFQKKLRALRLKRDKQIEAIVNKANLEKARQDLNKS